MRALLARLGFDRLRGASKPVHFALFLGVVALVVGGFQLLA